MRVLFSVVAASLFLSACEESDCVRECHLAEDRCHSDSLGCESFCDYVEEPDACADIFACVADDCVVRERDPNAVARCNWPWGGCG